MGYNKRQIKFSPQLRKHYADKTFDLMIVGAGAMIFGQFLSEKPFSWVVSIGGLGLVFIGYSLSYMFYSEEEAKNDKPR